MKAGKIYMQNTNCLINNLNQDVLTNLNVLNKSQYITEIRILTPKSILSGYYSDIEKLERDIRAYDGIYNIFFTLNPVIPEIKSRGYNKIIRGAKKTTSDNEIDSLRQLLIDIDPSRPAKVSSTDDELESARKLASDIKEFLDEYDFPEPLVCMSGNGYHLLYDIDLENTKENIDIIKSFLLALHNLFKNKKAEVDRTTYNSSRICKLYGTMATKGEDSQERPHRRSRIESIPNERQVVPREKLIEIAKLNSQSKSIDSNRTSSNSSNAEIEVWLEKYGIEVNHKKEWEDGKLLVLTRCPWNDEHTDKSAYIIQYPNGNIAAGCHHNSCQDENWTTLKEKYEPKNHISKGEKSMSKAEVILELIKDKGCEFFHNEFDEAHVSIPNYPIMKVRDRRFELYIGKALYDETKKLANKDSIKQVMDICEAEACFSGEEIKLFKRCTEKDNVIYYDLADKEHNCVKISSEGVTIESNKEIMFVNRKNQKVQVKPIIDCEDISILDKHYRFQSEDDRILHIISLVTSFIPNISHPIVVLYGEKGSSKTTTMRKDRSIIDPANSEIIALPKGIQDLALTLSNNYLSCFDNLENISAEKSNMLCMACTGGGFTARTLYTNDEETIHKFKVPIILNGINVVATKADLLDRCILIELERIPSYERREDSEIYRDFEADKPKILGAIFNMLSKAKQIYPNVQLNRLGRLADFTRWGYAVAEACEIGGENFLNAYLNNQARANQEALDSNPVANAVILFMNQTNLFEGKISELLTELNTIAIQNGIDIKSPLWANEANVLSRRLNELKSNLKKEGIEFQVKHKTQGKIITIEKVK